MALASSSQDDYGSGLYRGRKAPGNSVYDAVNALINDEGLPFRRGGSAYVTTSDAGTNLFSLKSSYYPAPSSLRTLAFSATNHYAVSGTAFVALGSSSGPWPPPTGSRIAAVGKLTAWPGITASSVFVGAYGGSLKTAVYNTGTVAVTAGSVAVVGTGTSWTANVDAGMIIDIAGSPDKFYLVKRVNSNTTLDLDEAWGGSTGSGLGYNARPVATSGGYDPIFQPALSTDARPYVAYAGRRLMVAYGTRVAFGPVDIPGTQNADEYHELPGDAFITGFDGIGDVAYVFTTEGIWTIGNLFFDAVDAFGNIQHTVERVNKDVILWGDAGIAAWSNGFVVPALDDVYVMAPDGSTVPVSGSIRPLYRSYVKAGYQPGLATVYRGHYKLPIMNGTTLVDTLVCRLDREGAPWTRWAGHSAAPGYTTQVGASTRSPKLLAVQGQRVLDLTGTHDPAAGNALEADGTTSDFVLTTRDFPTGTNQHGFVQRARLRYELVDDGSGGTAAPTVGIAYSSDQDAGVFTTLTEKGEQGGSAGWGVSAGDKYSWALVAKRRERIRFRITVAGACASFVLRSIELLLRPSGKQ